MTIAKSITKTLDISVEDVRIDLTATIRSYDLTDTQFVFEIKSSNGMTVNLTGSTAMYIVEYVHNSQTYAIQGDIDIIGNDTLSFNLPEDLKGYSGTVLIGIYVKLTDGTKIDIKDIAVRIEPSIMDKDIDFSAKTYFKDFESIKAEVVLEGEKAKTQINQVLPDVQAEGEKVKTNINAVVSDVNGYADSQKQAINNIVADVQSTGDTAKAEIKATLPSLQAQVSELKSDLDNIQDGIYENLFDENSADNVKNAYIIYNGNIQQISDERFAYSHFINVTNLNKITFKRFKGYFGENDSLNCYCYDSNYTFKKFIKGTAKTVGKIETVICEIPSDVKYVRINYIVGQQTMVMRGDEYSTDFIEFGKLYINNKFVLPSVSSELTTKPLYGKKIVNFGDSIFGLVRPPKDISTFLAEMTGAKVYNAGFGGCRMGWHSNANYDAFSMYRLAYSVSTGDWSVQDNALLDTSLPDYYAETVSMLKNINWNEVNIITIAYGSNDFTEGLSPWKDTEQEVSNKFNYYNLALRYSIETILSTYPNIRIFLIPPHYRFWVKNGNFVDDTNTHTVTSWVGSGETGTIIPFVEATKRVAKEYQLPYIDDYYDLGINKFNRTQYFNATVDGAHHNESGRRLIANHIANKLW